MEKRQLIFRFFLQEFILNGTDKFTTLINLDMLQTISKEILREGI